ncbi:MAG: hypothetical protein V1901_04415 [Patescibacteria group bacterium]
MTKIILSLLIVLSLSFNLSCSNKQDDIVFKGTIVRISNSGSGSAYHTLIFVKELNEGFTLAASKPYNFPIGSKIKVTNGFAMVKKIFINGEEIKW